MEHAQSALILLQEELFSGAMAGADGGSGVAQKVDRIAVLAIAYHNIGVEQEFLKRHEQSLHSYRKGVDIAETHLGNDHGITITLRNSHIAAQRVLATKGKGRGMRGGRQSRKKVGRKKQPRHVKGAKTTPTMREQERWDDITGAYGNLPGVEPVRSVPAGRKTEMMQGQRQESQEIQQSSVREMEESVEQNMIIDDGNNLTSNISGADDNKEAETETVDLDLLVSADTTEKVKDMITPRRGGEEKSDEVVEEKSEVVDDGEGKE